MKFKCGLTNEEREEHYQKLVEAVRRAGEWHKWFAWYPVTVAPGDCRWLEYVQRSRRGYIDSNWLGSYTVLWSYWRYKEA